MSKKAKRTKHALKVIRDKNISIERYNNLDLAYLIWPKYPLRNFQSNCRLNHLRRGIKSYVGKLIERGMVYLDNRSLKLTSYGQKILKEW